MHVGLLQSTIVIYHTGIILRTILTSHIIFNWKMEGIIQ